MKVSSSTVAGILAWSHEQFSETCVWCVWCVCGVCVVCVVGEGVCVVQAILLTLVNCPPTHPPTHVDLYPLTVFLEDPILDNFKRFHTHPFL